MNILIVSTRKCGHPAYWILKTYLTTLCVRVSGERGQSCKAKVCSSVAAAASTDGPGNESESSLAGHRHRRHRRHSQGSHLSSFGLATAATAAGYRQTHRQTDWTAFRSAAARKAEENKLSRRGVTSPEGAAANTCLLRHPSFIRISPLASLTENAEEQSLTDQNL